MRGKKSQLSQMDYKNINKYCVSELSMLGLERALEMGLNVQVLISIRLEITFSPSKKKNAIFCFRSYVRLK